MEIENVFEVGAPPDRVFAFLLDVERIVGCVPGAELVETIDDHTFKGRVRIKVGPITVSYTGNAEIADRNAEAHTAVLKASGRETSGSGSARATANMSVNPKDGGSEVRIVTDFSVAGRVANFGRGVMQDVSRRLIGQMADCIKSNLEVDPAGGPGGEASPGAGQGPHEAAIPPAAPMGGVSAPATTGEAVTGEPGSTPPSSAPETPPAETPAAEAMAAEQAAPPASSTPAERAPAPRTAAEAKPINAIGLMLSIVGERARRVFRRRNS